MFGLWRSFWEAVQAGEANMKNANTAKSCAIYIGPVAPPIDRTRRAGGPVRAPGPLVPSLGHQIEVVVRRVEQVDAARVGRVGMKHPACRILVEDAHPLPLG